AGMTQTKKLKDFFIDIKVPKRLRDQVPILCDGEKILWVVGHRVDARVLASEDSAKLLQIVVEPTNVKPKRPESRIKQQGGTDESDEFGYFGSPF
ncbi:MAG: tRNA lysidine(34) synthetase TilS, partial [Candidatus Cloacimonetes bacterium]|nr:tRNA lysidine(34) synthetase TilS [Candidatus Cloacimonadota bacterium]